MKIGKITKYLLAASAVAGFPVAFADTVPDWDEAWDDSQRPAETTSSVGSTAIALDAMVGNAIASEAIGMDSRCFGREVSASCGLNSNPPSGLVIVVQ